MVRMLACLTLSQRSLRLSSFLLILFSFSSLFHLFPPFYLPPQLSYLLPLILLLVPSRVFLSSVIALLIIYWVFFISSRSLLNLSCIFSILVSRLFICDSILISRFWIIFTIIILNYCSSRLPISSSFVWFGGHLSCFFTCWIFLCLFILFRLLCLGWPFCMLVVCGSSLLWRVLLWVGFSSLPWVASQGFLVRDAFVDVLVGGAGSLLSGVQWSVQ